MACSSTIYFAVRYTTGDGTVKDETRLYFFLKAAEQGHAEAQNVLGLRYENGQGVEKDYVKAIEWYSKAAAQNLATAQFNLGEMYNNGYGVKPTQQSRKAT